MGSMFATSGPVPARRSVDQVAQVLVATFAGSLEATIEPLEAVLARVRQSLAARGELLDLVPEATLRAELELRPLVRHA
jgi:hypothetical protein